METSAFDLCVIGAGPAGYSAAMRAHDLGKRIALVERGRVGGAGIHAGALSSKTMWHLSNDYAVAKRTDRGYRASGGIEVLYSHVCRSVSAAVTERRELLERQLARLATPSAKGGSVSLIAGSARFTSRDALAVTGPDGSVREVRAAHFLVATGSSPRVPDGIRVDGETVVTSDRIDAFPRFPESMVVVEAGVVGCEYATMFANFGWTKINVIDRQPRILPFEDEDVAEAIAKNFESMGITIHRSSKLESLEIKDGRVEYVITNAEGRTETIRVEKALVSIGRAPNTRGMGLEEIGVELDARGNVVARDAQSVSVPNVWAAGDVTMDIALVNIAELEGRFAVEKMFGLSPRPIPYEALSSIMFLSPEVASVGLNEQKARERKVPYRVAVLDNRLVARNVAMRNTTGFVKLLVEKETDKILGLRVVGAQASSTIQGIAFLIQMGATLDDLERCVHPHPAIPEGVQDAARALLGRSLMKVDVFAPDGLLRLGEG
jgi:dihydrolipoamide dehydrogenase